MHAELLYLWPQFRFMKLQAELVSMLAKLYSTTFTLSQGKISAFCLSLPAGRNTGKGHPPACHAWTVRL